MSIIKYTTSISVDKTVGEIQTLLAKAGAQAILCEYSPGAIVCAMSFRIETPHGAVFFRLPARTQGVLDRIRRDPKVPGRLKTEAQAARIAWRILRGWVEAQLAIIDVEMAEMAEVFLPFAQDNDGKTLYSSFKDGKFKMLAHKTN